MGMDLNVMILVGPLKLSKDRALTKKMLAAALKIQSKAGVGEEEGECEGSCGHCDECYASDIEESETEESALMNCDPEVVLEELHALWLGQLFRDVNTRVIRVGGESRRIVVAGGDTWGEEVDGNGYKCLRLADQLGFIKALGIK